MAVAHGHVEWLWVEIVVVEAGSVSELGPGVTAAGGEERENMTSRDACSQVGTGDKN